MRYETIATGESVWMRVQPRPELQTLLDSLEEGTIVTINRRKWRVKPRDEQLIRSIHNILIDNGMAPHRSCKTAEQLYDWLIDQGKL